MTSQFDLYASFDIESHTINALELILEKLRQAIEQPASWKWVVVGLHSAMHGGFALVLRRSDGAQLLPTKLEQKVYESWERERETGVIEFVHFDHVDWFIELYKKTQDPQRMSYLGGRPLTPTVEQNESIDKLNSFRGKFLHFSADSWLIEIIIFIDILNDVLPLLHFLLFEAQHGSFLYEHQERMARDLFDLITKESLRIQGFLEVESQKKKAPGNLSK
ncbi:hypothetical protein BH09CHL1_BH09CHL1_10620 [soil metagenome]